MTTGKQSFNSRQLGHTAKLLSLGQAIIHLDMATDSDPYTQKQVKQSPEELRQVIDSLTKELQRAIINDICMRPIRRVLNHFPRETPPEQICIISLVAFGMSALALSHTHDTADSVSMKAAKLFDADKIVGMLKARQVIGELLQSNILRLHDEEIYLCAEFRRWLAGRNPFSSFGVTEKDVDYQKKYATDKRICNHRVTSSDSNLKKRVDDIPFLNPQEIYDEIGKQGYIGQESARRSISLAAYRHVLRIKRIFVEGICPDDLPPRENVLLVGQTGSGKSFLIKTLFEKILNIPCSGLVDITGISSVGYVGGDVSVILQKLIQSADGNKEFAEIGVGCWDEIDKISMTGTSNSFFSGEGTTNDVSRGGVQRELLKMLEEDSVVDIPSQNGRPINRGSIQFATRNTLFIACGAFTGLDLIAKPKPTVGFGENQSELKTHDINALIKFGMARELVARFGSIVCLEPLSPIQLMEILERNTISRYKRELELSGIELIIDADVKKRIVEQAISRDTGARGLASELVSHLNDACFHSFSSSKPVKSVRLFMDKHSVGWDITHKQIRKKQTKETEKVA